MLLLLWAFRKSNYHRTQRRFRWAQVLSAAAMAFGHGSQDAQKTMGVITLALVAHKSINAGAGVPTWVVVASASSIGLGTYLGGWRIIRTLGHKLTDIEPPQGFAAEASGASVLLASSYFGYPLSTTHIVSGSVLGSGLGKRLAQVQWNLAGRMAAAWVVTLPAAALMAALVSKLLTGLGAQTAGPIVVSVLAAAGAVLAYIYSRRDPVTAADV
jgi:PiT family inorganic phosphate transporter